jgi:MYXO-CTERM domain-containing protein
MRMLDLGRLGLVASIALAACGPEGSLPPEELGTAEEASTTVCPPVTVEGLDVSAGQGTIDWVKVKASGREFAMIKATQGDYYTSSHWQDHWDGAKAAGLLRSAYHFFDPSVDAVAQAQHFLTVVGPLGPGDLPPMLDIECPTSSNQSTTQPNCEYGGSNPNSGWAPPAVLNQRIHSFLDYVEQQTGKTPLIYSYNYWFQDSGADTTTLHGYPLVISWPTMNSCYKVGLGNDFTSAAFWQWSVGGTPCPGVNTPVDLDRFNGSLDDLKLLAGLGGLSQVSGNDAMTLVNWPKDGHPEIFVQDRSGQMFHTYPDGNTDTWNTMYPLDTGSTCGAAAGFWPGQAYAEVFDPAADGSAQHLWLDFQTGWTKWQHDLPAIKPELSHLSTLVWPDGHMEVFALGGDHAIWHTHRAPGDPGWSAWESMGGDMATGAAAITWNDGHAEIFATDAKGAAWHDWSGSGAGFTNGWHGWETLGGSLASRPVPVRWADGHLSLFATGKDGQLYHTDYSTSFAPFTVLSAGFTIAGEPSAIMNTAGNGSAPGPEIFARSFDDKVVHLWWDGMKYTDFTPHFDQTAASDPFGWIRADGRAEVFAIDDQGVLTRSYHDPASGWTTWLPIGGTSLNPCVPTPPEVDGGATGGGGSGGKMVTGHVHASCSCRMEGRDEHPGAPLAALLGLAALVLRRRSPSLDRL